MLVYGDRSTTPFRKILSFILNFYQAPQKDHHPKTPSDGYVAPKGYDYNAPDGYDPAKNPTFPKRKYFPPTLPPSYQPPAAKEQTIEGAQ